MIYLVDVFKMVLMYLVDKSNQKEFYCRQLSSHQGFTKELELKLNQLLSAHRFEELKEQHYSS